MPEGSMSSALSIVKSCVTFTTESFGKPVERDGKNTLPGMRARSVFEVMIATTTVAIELLL